MQPVSSEQTFLAKTVIMKSIVTKEISPLNGRQQPQPNQSVATLSQLGPRVPKPPSNGKVHIAGGFDSNPSHLLLAVPQDLQIPEQGLEGAAAAEVGTLFPDPIYEGDSFSQSTSVPDTYTLPKMKPVNKFASISTALPVLPQGWIIAIGATMGSTLITSFIAGSGIAAGYAFFGHVIAKPLGKMWNQSVSAKE